MKNLRKNMVAKILAVVMVMILGGTFMFSFATSMVAGEMGMFNGNKPSYREYEKEKYNTLADMYVWNNYFLREKDVRNESPEVGFEVRVDNKKTPITSVNMEKFVDKNVKKGVVTHEFNDELQEITVYFGDIMESGQSQLILASWIMDAAYTLSYGAIGMAVMSGLLLILLLIFLVSAAGLREDGEVKGRIFEKIPFDLLAFLEGGCAIALFVLMIVFTEVAVDSGLDFGLFVSLNLLMYIALVGMVLHLLMSFAVRVKLGKWWRNTVIYRILKPIWRLCKKIVNKIIGVIKEIPYIWKVAVGLGIYLLIQLVVVVAASTNIGFFGFVWFVVQIFICYVILRIAIDMKKVKSAGKRLAEGQIDYQIDVDSLRGELKEHAENFNAISKGMAIAVEERLKSERFKTELITNVSHDIKTPLTSIINYADLLEKENIDNENAKEYIEVLSRQSQRLKKLIDDLMEASKAASGVISIEKVPCNIGTMINQSIGEYEEKLMSQDLQIIANLPEENLFISADGRRLWRVFDNLLNNICKYAQPGTRVYVDLKQDGGMVEIVYKNTSKYQLNVTGDELIERFVRGDKSRHTEGSGLGLSIAKNLTELQDGTFDIEIDGDLFKAVIRFKAI